MFDIWRIFKLINYLFFFSTCTLVMAVELEYGINLSLAKYDNINHVLNPNKTEWGETTTGVINIVENSADLVLNMNARSSIINYRYEQLEDTTNNSLNLGARWILSPRQFEWAIVDVYTQTVIDPQQSNTQNNRQNTNIFSTGPNYYWRLNSRNNINVEARLERISYETTDGDSDRLSSALRWVLQLDSALTASINTETERLTYLSGEQSNFTRNNIFARTDYIRGRYTFAGEIGVTSVDYDTQNNFAGQRYLLSMQNQRTRTSDISFIYSHNITDAGSAIFSASQNFTNGENINNIPAVSATDIFTQDSLSINYNRTSSNGAIVLEMEGVKQNYEIQNTLDMESQRTSILPTFNFSQTSSIEIEARQTKSRFIYAVPFIENIDILYRATFYYNTGRNTRWSLGYEEENRKSSNLLTNYTDKRIIATFNYISR